MYKYRRARRRTAWAIAVSLPQAAGLFVFLAIALQASRPPRFEERRVSRGVSISLHRSSPPYAALEDDLMDAPADAALAPLRVASVDLEAGRESLAPLAMKISAHATDQAREWIFEARRAGFQRSARAAQVASLRRSIDQTIHRASLSSGLIGSGEGLAPALARAHERVGPEILNRKGLSAALGQSERESKTRPARAKLSSFGGSRSRAIASLFAPIVAEGGAAMAQKFAASAGASPSEAARAGMAVATAMAIRAPARGAFGAAEPESPLASAVAALAFDGRLQEKPEMRDQIVVSGGLEVTAGLALTDPKDRVIVYREVDGRMAESGAVSLKEARYEILVSERLGRIVAELQSPSGETIGRGVVELEALGPASARFRYDQFDLKMAPVPSGFIGRALAIDDLSGFVSAAKGELRAGVRGARIELDSASGGAMTTASGEFDVRRALEGSTAIARATKGGFWNALGYVAAGSESRLALFAQKAVAALLGAIDPSAKEASARLESAIAWGRVTKNGKLVAGAEVELMTAAEGVRAVYFDASGRPDLSLRQTSDSGLYAFFPVLPGVQLAHAALAGAPPSETIVFPAEAGATTRADIELAFNRRVSARVFDAFHTARGLQARMASYGREQISETDSDGKGEALVSSSDGSAFVDVDAGREYLTSRIAIPRDRRRLLAPMIRQSWFDELSGALRVTQRSGAGTAIAFVQGDKPYRVWFSGDGRKGPETIAYFDPSGRPTGEDFGRPGGGFVAFNLAEGLRTATLEPWQGGRWSYQTFLVERRVVDVASIWLR